MNKHYAEIDAPIRPQSYNHSIEACRLLKDVVVAAEGEPDENFDTIEEDDLLEAEGEGEIIELEDV